MCSHVCLRKQELRLHYLPAEMARTPLMLQPSVRFLLLKKEEKREKNKNKPTLHGLLHLPGNAAPSRPTFEALEAGEADAWR